MQRLTKSYHRVYCCGLINHWLIVVEQFLPGIPSLNRLQSNNNNNTHNNRDLEIGGQNSLESLWVLTSWPWLSVCLQKCTLSLVSLFKLPNNWAIWAKVLLQAIQNIWCYIQSHWSQKNWQCLWYLRMMMINDDNDEIWEFG